MEQKGRKLTKCSRLTTRRRIYTVVKFNRQPRATERGREVLARKSVCLSDVDVIVYGRVPVNQRFSNFYNDGSFSLRE